MVRILSHFRELSTLFKNNLKLINILLNVLHPAPTTPATSLYQMDHVAHT